MSDPLVALIIAFFVLAVALYFFWPEKGLLDFRRKANKNNDRVLIEDTLKFLFDNEYKSQKSPIQSIAGTLNLSIDKITRLIPKLESLGLVDASDKNDIKLTDQGRSYALRVIRIHRIWERYLADETSIEEKHWHNEADLREHSMSISEANKLASKIGNPVIDPHGDPIPSIEGELPDFEGIALNELTTGSIAKIIHIEDEPRTIYLQLLAMGMYPGMEIRLLENSKDKVGFELNGEEHILAPIFAANVTVRPKATKQYNFDNASLLSNLKLGGKAKVLGISPACRKQQKRRLMDLGIVPGTEIEVLLESAGKNPRAYKLLNTLIALRKKHAAMVIVELINA